MNIVQELASKFIELINFDHLLTQQEAEKIENQLGNDDEEPEEEEEGKEMDLFDETGAFDENQDSDLDLEGKISSKRRVLSCRKKYTRIYKLVIIP